MSNRLRPLNDHVLIKQAAPARTLGTGIIVAADSHKPWPPEGIVEAVGPGRVGEDGERVPMSVSVGDRVLFDRRPSSELEGLRTSDDERWLMLRDEDIIAVLDRDGITIGEGSYNPARMHRAAALR